MWEDALRVPFVMFIPWEKTAGLYDDRLFTHIDIIPTLLDIAGIKYDKNEMPGISIKEVLADKRADRSRIHMSQYNAHGIKRQAIREGRWKLIHHHKVDPDALEHLNSLHKNIPHADPRDLPSIAVNGERFEMYDLQKDPLEKTDLIKTMAGSEQFKSLAAELKKRAGTSMENNALSPDLIQALEAAGYFVSSKK
jgi:N-sulfoglucosamine sulfohydrolase